MENEIERLLTLLNEKEVMLRDRELDLNDQEEKFMSQKEELNAAIEELMAKNTYLTSTLAELEQRNNELDQILYRASHDLKTPVSSLFGLIGIMRSTALTPEQVAVVDHMLKKSTQMESLLASLSDLSTAFFKPITAETFSVSEIIEEEWAKVNARENVSFHLDGREVHFCSDKVLFRILFSCLLQNAATFSRHDVKNQVTVQCSTTSSHLKVEVGDSGEEIAPEIADKIFEMFFRGSERSSGRGLGLYTAQRIAARLKGKIILANVKKRKTFIVTIPEL